MDNNTPLSYIAGFMDGEGCFRVGGPTPMISVSNTNFEVIHKIGRFLDYLSLEYGIGERISRTPNLKPQLILTISKVDASKVFCELLLPHLIVKKEEAQLIIDLCTLRQNRKTNAHYTPEEHEQIKKLMLKSKELKSRRYIRV